MRQFLLEKTKRRKDLKAYKCNELRRGRLRNISRGETTGRAGGKRCVNLAEIRRASGRKENSVCVSVFTRRTLETGQLASRFHLTRNVFSRGSLLPWERWIIKQSVYLLPYSRCFLTANLPRYVARQRPEAENWRPVCPTLFTKGRGRTQQFHPRGKSARQRSPRRYARRTAVDRHNSRCCIILPIGFPYVIAISVQRPCEINFLRPRVWQREAR